MNKKKILIVSLCAVLLCGILGVSIAIVSAQGDSEPEDSDSIPTSQEAASDAVESTAPSENKPIEEPIDKSNDPPMVVTRSLVQEEPESEIIDMYDKALLQKALDTYAGQNVTFRVVVSVSYYQEWNDSTKVDGFYSFHRLIGIDHCTCAMCDAYRQNHQDEAGKPVYGDLHRGEFSGEFYITEEVVCDAIGFEPLWFAELDEASLRALIGCGGPIVALIDEFPEPLWLEFPYKAPSTEENNAEPIDVPAVVTRSHMAEKVGENADLIQEALKLYAGQDVKYCVMVTAEEKAGFESFMELAVELYRAQYHCEVWPGCSDGSIMGGYGDYLEDYQNDLYGTFYIDEDMKDWYWQHKDDAWQSPLYAELPEAALRAVLECNGVSVRLFDAFPEDVTEIDVSVAA